MTRQLAVEGRDVTFEPGRIVAFSIMAWDGGNGESGLRQSLSSWYAMQLDAPIPARAWALGALGLILTGFLEVLLVCRARRHDSKISG